MATPGLVAQYAQGAFSTPINGTLSDATVVLANDNNVRTKHNSHDADPTIHVQSSTLASRPAAGTAQRIWITTDGLRAYMDSGAVWSELAYLPLVGGTVTGATAFSSTLSVAGDAAFGRAIDAGVRLRVQGEDSGAVNYAMYITNLATTVLFSVRNDGLVSIPAGTLQVSQRVLATGTVLDLDSVAGGANAVRINRQGGTGGVIIYAGNTATENANFSDAGALTLRAGISATTGTFSGLVAGATGYEATAAGAHSWNGRSIIRSSADGSITLLNNAETGFTSLYFGGTTSSFPKLKRSTTELFVQLGDESAYANVTLGQLTTSGVTTGDGPWTFGDAAAIAITSANKSLKFTVAGTTYYVPAKLTRD